LNIKKPSNSAGLDYFTAVYLLPNRRILFIPKGNT